MKRNLFNNDKLFSKETTSTKSISSLSLSSSSTSNLSTLSSASNESSSSFTTTTSSQETTSTASVLTPSYVSSYKPSILYQHRRLLFLQYPIYINNKDYYNSDTMTASREKEKEKAIINKGKSKTGKLNELIQSSSASASSTSSSSSVSVKQYKNSPFGLTGHYLTMPDSNVHSSAIMLNRADPNDADDADESLELAGDDVTPASSEEVLNHNHRHHHHHHQEPTNNQTKLHMNVRQFNKREQNDFLINTSSAAYPHPHHHQMAAAPADNNNWLINNNDKNAIHQSNVSLNQIDLNEAHNNKNSQHNDNLLNSSPLNSFTHLEQHNNKTPWLLDYHHNHNHNHNHIKQRQEQPQPPHSSQPKSVNHLNHHNNNNYLYQEENLLSGNLSPAGDAGLDAKKCNAKDIEKGGDCFTGMACHPSKSSSTTTIPFETNNHHKQKKLLNHQEQHESGSLLVRFSSIMYATFLVILGCILHVSELRQKSKNSSDHIYTTIVALIGISWLLFLQMDLQRYKRYASKFILIETIFNDHRQKQKLQRRQELALASGAGAGAILEPSARSTTSSSASLVNDRMSMNTEVIFKKTAYKMYQRRAALDYHRQNKHHYKSHGGGGGGGIGSGADGMGDRARKVTGKSSISSLNSHGLVNSRYHSDMYHKSAKDPSLAGGSGGLTSERDNLVPAYKFLHGKMGANFYLKCGMAAFCFGHVIHEGLRFGQQVYFFGDGNVHCRDSAALVAHLITPLYSFYQLFMMFKYSNLVINRHKVLARFGLMHIIGTSVTFWFRTILEEAFEDFVHKMDYFKTNRPQLNLALAKTANNNSSNIISMLTSISGPGQLIKADASDRTNWSYSNQNAEINNNSMAQSLLSLMSSPLSATITPQIVRHLPDSYACAQNTLLTTKSMNALPYLYPFTIEYNLLLAATFLSLYFNIGKIGSHGTGKNNEAESTKCIPFYSSNYSNMSPKPISMMSSGSNSQFESSDSSPIRSSKYHHHYQSQQHYRDKDLGEYKSNFVVNADCHSANKGLFCGFFVLLVTLVTIVIFFVTINKPTHIQLGIKINLIQEATLTALILIVTLAGFKQVVKLNRNPYAKDKVTTDDVLMLIPLPFFFIHSLLSFRAETASMSSANINGFSSILLQRTHNHDVQESITTSTGNLQSLVLSKNNNNDNSDNNNSNSNFNNRDNKTDLEFRARLNNLFVNHNLNGTNSRFVQDIDNDTKKGREDGIRSVRNISSNVGSNSFGVGNNSQIDHFKLVTVALNIIVMIEVLVQTNFIIDGMRRCSESRYLRFKKPGRELITFAIILNITYWIVATFETKSIEQYKTEIEYYGPLPYMFISHTTLPVMLFYRYHSSVCLAEIWNRAYKPPKKR